MAVLRKIALGLLLASAAAALVMAAIEVWASTGTGATAGSPPASEIHYQLACLFAASHDMLDEKLASDIEDGGRIGAA